VGSGKSALSYLLSSYTHGWFLVGGPTKIQLWLVSDAIGNQQTLVLGLHLKSELLTQIVVPIHITYVVGSEWLPNFWLILDTITKSLRTGRSQ
jgi:hypothetical protein